MSEQLPDPANPPDLSHFWPSLLRAVGTEPRELSSLNGASGISHDFVAAGADEEEKRLVVISAEADSSGAAMAQADIQAAMQEVKVIVARPVIIDLASLGRSLEEQAGRPALTGGDIAVLQEAQETGDPDVQKQANERVAQMFAPLAQQIHNARAVGSINLQQGLSQFIEQMLKMNWQMPSDDQSAPIADFSKLLAMPTPHTDSQLGVCGIPIYGFDPDELELIHSGSDQDQIEAILRRHDILQYFFPSPDQTALALVDRGQTSREVIEGTAETAPEIGHPYGASELVTAESMHAMIDALQDRKLIVEGELGYELTPDGEQQRAAVRFKPREGFISKLINRVSVKINLKSIFKIG
jgi:hypothetical protein